MSIAAGRTCETTVFGRPLEEIAKFGLPAVFTSALRWLKANALTTEGLFRTKGDGQAILRIKRAYDLGEDPIAENRVSDSHTVAGVLKLWLSCLPKQVIPAKCVLALFEIQALGLPQLRIECLRGVLLKMDHRTVELLYQLFEFLHHYKLNQRNGRLPAPDLARIFMLLLIRPPRTATANDLLQLSASLDCLITDYRPIFTQPRVRQTGLGLDVPCLEKQPDCLGLDALQQLPNLKIPKRTPLVDVQVNCQASGPPAFYVSRCVSVDPFESEPRMQPSDEVENGDPLLVDLVSQLVYGATVEFLDCDSAFEHFQAMVGLNHLPCTVTQ